VSLLEREGLARKRDTHRRFQMALSNHIFIDACHVLISSDVHRSFILLRRNIGCALQKIRSISFTLRHEQNFHVAIGDFCSTSLG